MKCPKISMSTGTPCELEAGHDGKHQMTYTVNVPKPYTVYWTEDADRRLIDQESRKKLGT